MELSDSYDNPMSVGWSDGKGPIIPGKLVDGKFVADGAMPMPAESAQEST